MDKILLMQCIPGFGLKKIKRFLDLNKMFIGDDDYFNYLLLLETGFNVNNFRDKVKIIKDDCFKLGVKIINCDFEDIVNRPLLLYMKGDLNLINYKKTLSVVGTRAPSVSGIKLGREFVIQAVDRGWITVSGLAKGCDMLAHKTTLSSSGKTVAVIPMGYREDLAPWILEGGLFVSEYPPYTRIEKFRYIHRNRIITGLSRGLFVIETNKGSGSEHSMEYAFEKNIPIAYCIGYKGIEKYSEKQINNWTEFDLFLNRCVI